MQNCTFIEESLRVSSISMFMMIIIAAGEWIVQNK